MFLHVLLFCVHKILKIQKKKKKEKDRQTDRQTDNTQNAENKTYMYKEDLFFFHFKMEELSTVGDHVFLASKLRKTLREENSRQLLFLDTE